MPDEPYWRRPHGYTLFCDDVRSEVGNKQTIVGLYNRAMYVTGDFPLLVPKLGFVLYYGEPSDLSIADIEAKVIFETAPGREEQVLFAATVTADQRRSGAGVDLSPAETPQSERIRSVRLGGVLAPLMLPAPGSIKARIYREGIEIKIGRLQVLSSSSEQALAMQVPASIPVTPQG